MSQKKKRMIKVTFTGKELFGNTVFDTTEEKVAKEANIFDSKRLYSPLTVITGEHEFLPLVEKELDEMKEGEEKLIKLLAKDAFGERKTDLVRVIPLQNFFEQKINPFPGLIIRIGNTMGKVQSVGSGRVRVDFNHLLAGRDVEYKIKLEKEFIDKKEVSEQLYEKYYSRIPGSKKDFANDTLTITLEGNAFTNLEKVNEAIKKLAEELGVIIEFKEGAKMEGVKIEHAHVHHDEHNHEDHKHNNENEGHEHNHNHEEHVHGPECRHEHEHNHGCEHNHLHESEEEENSFEEHVHNINCNHEHTHEPVEDEQKSFAAEAKSKMAEEENQEQELVKKEKPLSIHELRDAIAKEKKSSGQFNVTRDSATTIQRPKKKF